MNPTKHKHLLYVILILLVALGSVGVAYGQWVEALEINGSVATGNIYAVFLENRYICTDNDPLNLVDLTYSLDGTKTVLQVNVVNGYPGYWLNCTAWSELGGSIPMKLSSIEIEPAPNGDLASCVKTQVGGDTFEAICSSDEEIEQLFVEFSDGIGTVFGTTIPFTNKDDHSLWVEVLDTASEQADLDFTITYTYEQAVP